MSLIPKVPSLFLTAKSLSLFVSVRLSVGSTLVIVTFPVNVAVVPLKGPLILPAVISPQFIEVQVIIPTAKVAVLPVVAPAPVLTGAIVPIPTSPTDVMRSLSAASVSYTHLRAHET